MARPSKPTKVIEMEKKSHRTKAELEYRQKQEQSLVTGKEMKISSDIKNNKNAALKFKEVSGLLKIIDKNDALLNTVINRYCKLHAECIELESSISDMKTLYNEVYNDSELKQADIKTYIQAVINIKTQVQTDDKLL